MPVKIRILCSLLCVLALSGCVDRAQADAKLARACEAGVNALFPEGQEITKIVNKTFQKSPVGPGFRHITLDTIKNDDWLEEEIKVECIFEESFGFLNANYVASIYQVRTGDQTYGQSGKTIMGDAQDFIKLTDAVREALYE